MIDPTRVLLVAVVIVLTIMMVLIGWQIYQILLEIRKMLKKSNLMMDNAAGFSAKIGKSFESLSGFSEGVKAVLSILNVFRKGEKKDGEGK